MTPNTREAVARGNVARAKAALAEAEQQLAAIQQDLQDREGTPEFTQATALFEEGWRANTVHQRAARQQGIPRLVAHVHLWCVGKDRRLKDDGRRQSDHPTAKGCCEKLGITLAATEGADLTQYAEVMAQHLMNLTLERGYPPQT